MHQAQEKSPCGKVAPMRARCVEPSSLDQSSLPKRGENIALHSRIIFFFDGIPRDKHKIKRLGEFVLMLPIRFAQQTLGATADYRVADLFAHHHAETRGRIRRETQPVGDETTFHSAFTSLTDAEEIARLLDAGATAQTATGWRCGRHGRIKPA